MGCSSFIKIKHKREVPNTQPAIQKLGEACTPPRRSCEKTHEHFHDLNDRAGSKAANEVTKNRFVHKPLLS